MYDQVLTHNGYPCFPDAELQRHQSGLRRIMEKIKIEVVLAYGAGFFNPAREILKA